MAFPKNSAFNQEPSNIRIRVNPKQKVATAKVGVTTVYTSDIEDLEHDLRDLAFADEDPSYGKLFEQIADRLASFYKG